jgi:hypothetical protein
MPVTALAGFKRGDAAGPQRSDSRDNVGVELHI